MAGSATVTIVPSSMTMSDAVHRMPSASQRLAGGAEGRPPGGLLRTMEDLPRASP